LSLQGSLWLGDEQCSHLLAFPSRMVLLCVMGSSSLEVGHEPEEAEICLDPGMSLCSWPFAELLFGL